jgi:hypothetical protein
MRRVVDLTRPIDPADRDLLPPGKPSSYSSCTASISYR